MALSLADRVRETTTTTGTGTVTLAGAVTGYQSFAVVGNGNSTYYCIAGQGTSEWEVGIGTYTSSGTTLARTTVLASSNSGSLVNFSAGTKDVFVTYPGERAVVTSVISIASASTITPDSTYSQYEVTALAVPATIAAPSGTPIDGQKLLLRIVDNGTARALTWTTSAGAYRPRNVSLPVSTVASNQMYVGCIYNAADNYWDVLSVSTGLDYTTNGVVYANSTTSLATGTALTFDGTNFATTGTASATKLIPTGGTATGNGMYLPASNTLAWSNNGSESMRLDSSGNLGIGTSSPGTKLEVSGQGKFNALTFAYNTSYYNQDNQISNYSSGNHLYVSGNGTSTGGLYLQGGGNQKQNIIIDGNSAGGNITFGTNGTERMRLDASGNLGIGTSSPSCRLDVQGAGGSVALQIKRDASNVLQFYQGGGINYLDTAASGQYAFLINGSEKMRLDASGNLGLGVTPSAWAAGSKNIQISTATAFAQSANGYALVGNNCYEYSADAYKYLVSSYQAALYRQSSGVHAWLTAPSGTAGNAITFTQAMTLDASGKLAIGNTSPGSTLSIGSGATGGYNGGVYLNRGASTYNFYEASDGTNTVIFGLDNTISAAKIGSVNSFPIGFYTNNTERARITSAGNLGVGTTSPYSAIGVTGDITLGGTPSPGGSYGKYSWRYGNSASFGAAGYIDVIQVAAGNSGSMIFATNNNTPDTAEPTERMRIDSSGNLLVGTTSAAYSSSGRGLVEINGSSNSLLALKRGDTNNFYIQNVSDGVYLQNTANTPVIFGTNNSERARIDSSGNLGIGTSSPGSRLTVATASGNAYAEIARASKSTGQVALQLTGGTSGTNWIVYQAANSDNLTFFGNSSDRMTLDTSGNLGIGASTFGTSAAKVIGIADGTAPTTSPANMGQLYVEAGALKYRGSSGTVTTIANA